MPDSFETLEDKIRGLLGAIDRLETENRSFRSMAGENGGRLSHQEIVNQVESLRLEKEKLEKKLALVEQTIGRVLGQLDRLELE